MKFIKLFSSDTEMNNAISQIKHGDGAFLFGVSTANGIKNVDFCNHIHPGPNCLMLGSVNMSPVKLDSSSSKKTLEVADVLYSTADGKLTLDALTNGVNNTAIAICVIPEVMENFSEGDNSEGSIKTARFVSLNYMNYKTPATGSVRTQNIYFGNYNVTIGNVKGKTDETSYVGGKWNTQLCLSKSTNQDLYICDGVTNNKGAGYCAPACCCVTYSTQGTKPGDWYLPMPGELYQLYENKTAINEKRIKFVGKKLVDGNYWSSRECDWYEYYISFYFGNIGMLSRDSSPYVLGFLALEI